MSFKGLDITEDSLGEGGFGTVFVGQLDGIKVAVKKLSQSEQEFNNLMREASKLKRLRYGKHIAHIHGITMKDKDLYMVMEYSEHGDLRNYLERNMGSVTYEQKILFCRGILLGLSYCHSMNIFHGDIKCSNVILGKNLEPKLTDFGLSMTVDNIKCYSKLRNGSLYWAAPELFSIEEDEAVYQEFITDLYPCDVYSLGATFCEISYNGTTEFIDSDEPAKDIIVGIVSPIPKDAFLEEIVNCCCQFDRHERISLEECFSMLEKIAEEQLLGPENQSGFDFSQTTENKWKQIQKQIKAKPTQEPPPSFILHRPNKNLVVGLSNLSLLEWLCINSCVDAVKYMIKLHNPDQKQLQWLYSISSLCRSSNATEFLGKKARSHICPNLSTLIDSNPQQFIEALIRAGANYEPYLLHKAIKKHYNQIVRILIDLNHSSGGWALHFAIECNNLEAVKILATGSRLEFRDRYDDTPLHAAIDTGDVEIVKILLARKADVHSKNEPTQHSTGIGNQHTPLVRAAAKGNHEIVELLINAGATIDTDSSEWHSLVQDLELQGKNAIIQLISNAMRKGANEAEESHSTAVSTSNSEGENKKSAEVILLCTAIQNRQSDLVQKFIDDGSDVNEQGCDKYLPLHWAVIIGDERVVKLLLGAGSDIDIKTPYTEQNQYSPSSSSCFSEYTPLHIAIAKRHLGIAKLLIESGADFSAKNGSDQTITDIANQGDQREIETIIRDHAPAGVKSLQRVVELMGTEKVRTITMETVKAIVSRQQVDSDILSGGLHTAASCGNMEAVNYFMECGADVKKQYNGWSPLGIAVHKEHVQVAQILIDAGANVNARDDYGRTPLFESAKKSLPEIAQLLIGKGADVNAIDKSSCTPIYYAKCGEIMQILIKAKANVNAKNWCEQTSLHQYVIEAQTEMVQFLVDSGADINAKDTYGCAPIWYAKSREIAKILVNAGADVNIEYKYGKSLLHRFVRESNTEMVQFLVDKSADVNPRDILEYALIHYAESTEIVETLTNAGADVNAKNEYGESLLHRFVRESNIEMVQFLVDKGANVNIGDTKENTSIHYAESAEIVQILINADADVNAKNQDGKSPLYQFVEKSNTEMVQFLVDKGANVNIRDTKENTSIHYAKSREIVEILINAGADVNAINQYRVSLLYQFVEKSNTEMVQFLVDKGANVNIRDTRDTAPINYAKSTEILQILINAGADVNAINQHGESLLHQFVRESNIDVVQFLVDKVVDINARDIRENAPIHYVKSKKIAEILVNANADANIKNVYEKTLLNILLEEQNKNLGNAKYQRKEICEFLEYLRKLNK